jgi:MurNAc alpha-1-phosphate uridylyltransferase
VMIARGESRSMPMVAILAGGLATRLHPTTRALPKSMVCVAGEPFVAHQLRRLAKQEFREVVICAGHLSEQIEAFVGDGSAFGCSVRYSFDGERLLGTGGALRHALPMLKDKFLVMYGDSYLVEPFADVWEAFLGSNKAALMTIFRNEGQFDTSNVEFRDGDILRYEKSVPTSAANRMSYIDYGLGCINSDVFAGWAKDQAFDLALFYRAMLEQRELAGYEVENRFYEIGSPAGLSDTEAFLSAVSDHARNDEMRAENRGGV